MKTIASIIFALGMAAIRRVLHLHLQEAGASPSANIHIAFQSVWQGRLSAITNFFPIDMIGCYGTGACAPQPNTYVPGKAVVFAGVELYGDCSIGVGYVAAEEVNSPPPGSGWSIYYVGYADAFNSNNPATAYVIDSCIAAQQTFDSGLTPCP